MHWPQLREELALLPGPPLRDGQPSWTLHDPPRNQFFRLDWLTFEVLKRWWQGNPDAIAQEISQCTTLSPTREDVLAVATFLQQNQLTQIPLGSAPRLAAERRAQNRSVLNWLLHHYLFFRIPLFRPDRWLERALAYVKPLASPVFLAATLFAFLFGLLECWRQWDRFTVTLADTFTLQGLLAYGAALSLSKLLHELGHAFVTKAYGCRVPSMGIAFLVMWPVPYTDTQESWRLTHRRHRLQIVAAGIGTELVLAAWSLAAWALLPDGAIRSAALILATATWATTLALNASPFMRFDGYFMLSDALDFPNLHERSFALARWHLRERLFALGDPPPEAFTQTRTRWLIAFAWATWLYRLVLFVGIALLVYAVFFKVLGVVLFGVEIVWFVLMPLWKELKVWRTRWADIRQGKRLRWMAGWGGAFLVALILPWPGTLDATALLRPLGYHPIHTVLPGQLTTLPLQDRQSVTTGHSLFTLEAPEVAQRQDVMQARAQGQRWQAATAAIDTESTKRLQSTLEQLETAERALLGAELEQNRLSPVAPFDARVHLDDPDLAVGQWLSAREKLGTLIADAGEWIVETWLDEASIQRLRVGDRGVLVLPGQAAQALRLTVQSIDLDAARTLPRGELAALHGGHILTRERNGTLIPEQAVYRVVMHLDEPLAPTLRHHTWRGTLGIRVEGAPPLLRYLRHATGVLIREMAF